MAVELYVRYKKRTTHSLNFEEAKAIVRCNPLFDGCANPVSTLGKLTLCKFPE
jgi:hypothetical protein